MKLSECWIGRIVQDKDKTYDETMSSYSLGHVEGFEVLNGNIYVLNVTLKYTYQNNLNHLRIRL